MFLMEFTNDEARMKCNKLSSKSRNGLQAPNVLKIVEGLRFISWFRIYAVYSNTKWNLRLVELPLTIIQNVTRSNATVRSNS